MGKRDTRTRWGKVPISFVGGVPICMAMFVPCLRAILARSSQGAIPFNASLTFLCDRAHCICKSRAKHKKNLRFFSEIKKTIGYVNFLKREMDNRIFNRAILHPLVMSKNEQTRITPAYRASVHFCTGCAILPSHFTDFVSPLIDQYPVSRRLV